MCRAKASVPRPGVRSTSSITVGTDPRPGNLATLAHHGRGLSGSCPIVPRGQPDRDPDPRSSMPEPRALTPTSYAILGSARGAAVDDVRARQAGRSDPEPVLAAHPQQAVRGAEEAGRGRVSRRPTPSSTGRRPQHRLRHHPGRPTRARRLARPGECAARRSSPSTCSRCSTPTTARTDDLRATARPSCGRGCTDQTRRNVAVGPGYVAGVGAVPGAACRPWC